MKKNSVFDVIIIGGSYSGLAAAMALGRALKNVLVIDSGLPCNRQTPHSHNFLTQDGRTPKEIAAIAKQQVAVYDTVSFVAGKAVSGEKKANGFSIQTESGEIWQASQLIFATGIRDVLPAIKGIAESWGISVLHCPYCHGYEVRNRKTGIIGNGEVAFEQAKLIANWTKELTVFTNGAATFTGIQRDKLAQHGISIEEKELVALEHTNGQVRNVVFADHSKKAVDVLYIRSPFEQHCGIPEMLGCELTEEGYLKTDASQETTVSGIYACGDNASRMRTVANAVATGTAVGMGLSRKMIMEQF
ncbi:MULTISPECIES: NAD(P)/FAD-dependent oxidoreductase [unclassified Flavobacterium]|uniref:NAD(P)/FAD-dependent oxidoreductase n=1 Tax=unclassified Flavobacterium TaxID=196869 RepID=UPI00095C9DD7|nr:MULTISPECIES: NAD(P)/FAD-dependent oxidoreductase [unclassified Flavobacterium]MBN9286210.1 NAD(P)/FAD-dependent oxidoreductase [Flavobacterium sp.]OJV67252.1 MAG: pyridine nucleotide-disulfide oxidoreductase [Flavobacterium sp. 40-81]